MTGQAIAIYSYPFSPHITSPWPSSNTQLVAFKFVAFGECDKLECDKHRPESGPLLLAKIHKAIQ